MKTGRVFLWFCAVSILCGAMLGIAHATVCTPQTIGTTAANISSQGAASTYLDVISNSPTATICLNTDGPATISNGACAAGEITLPPLWHKSWGDAGSGAFVPHGAISAIASTASTPASVCLR